MKYFVIGVSGLVLAVVVLGFFVTGSPMRARQEKFDEIRVNNLQTTQNNIADYYRINGKIPASLPDLRGGFFKDPQTGKFFDYEVSGTTTFKLCADFNFASSQNNQNYYYPSGPYYLNFSVHGADHFCFTGQVDPISYQPMPKL